MSTSRTSSIAFALLTSLLNRRVGLQQAAQYTWYGKSEVALLLREEALWNDEQLIQRATHAPWGAYLAFDFIVNEHSGKHIEGLGYHYSSSAKASRYSHRFASSALVKYGLDPVPIQLQYAVSKDLATGDYVYRTPSEWLTDTVELLQKLGIHFAGVLADGEFSSNRTILFHVEHGINYLGRIKSNRIVEYNGQKIQLSDLAKQFPFKQCHLDKRVGWRSIRIGVKIAEVEVDILIVYRQQNGIWRPFFLVSTFGRDVPMAELLRAWKARWGIEVIHRFIKQNLSFNQCHSRTIIAHQNWATLVLDAFIAVLEFKHLEKLDSWRAAQQIAAEHHVRLAVTGLSSQSPPKFFA